MKPYRAIAEYYDAEYESQSMLRHDVPFYLEHLPKKRQSVLELAIGTARAAIPIAQSGHRVVGVDYASDLLEIAQRKRDAVGLREKDLSLIHGDLTDPKLDLGGTFDRICIFFNTLLAFPRLADQDRLLSNVRRHLKRSGRFWIDIFQPDLGMLAPMVQTGLQPSIFYVPQFDRTVYRATEIRRDPVEQLQHVTFLYRWFDSSGRVHRERMEFDMTYLFPRELGVLLERHGMTIEQLWGNYDGSASGALAPRIIASCKLI